MNSLFNNDTEKRLQNYIKTHKIGEGTYGEVFEAFDTQHDRVKYYINNRK